MKAILVLIVVVVLHVVVLTGLYISNSDKPVENPDGDLNPPMIENPSQRATNSTATGNKNSAPLFTPAKTINYKIKSGDNLTVIARKHDISLPELCKANNMTTKDIIRVGQVLKIPVKN